MKDDYSQTVLPHRPPFSAGKVDASLSSSSLSVRDVMRQRYSVTWHPRLLYLIVSDGYMATVMRVLHRPSPVTLLKMLLKDTTSDLEKLSEKLCKSQVKTDTERIQRRSSMLVSIFFNFFYLCVRSSNVSLIFRFRSDPGCTLCLVLTLRAASRHWTPHHAPVTAPSQQAQMCALYHSFCRTCGRRGEPRGFSKKCKWVMTLISLLLDGYLFVYTRGVKPIWATCRLDVGPGQL